ncbi:MAG: ABC transporter permease [bacterium]|jgi:peptide/nickel transport system permease protein|nr:ABC transporter permease [Planctomycetota bacterium]HIL53309.1 ABC transporter permease [Planctomycetota bacterium]
MWSYTARRLLYNIPVYLGIVLLLMLALRVNDPANAFLGKNANPEDLLLIKERLGLDRPFLVQYFDLLKSVFSLDFGTYSWANEGITVGRMLRESVVPSLSITLPALILTSTVSITIALISAFFRGRRIDRALMVLAVVGMSVSFLVYIVFGQYFGAYLLTRETGYSFFAIGGYESGLANWPYYCLLPVLISSLVAMGYDTRFYRAVMVEESGRDYIVTATAKGASKRKVMFVHMLKNAMIPIITRIMTTLPFLIMGSLLLEVYFNIPGMGRVLYKAIQEQDFPVIQIFVAIFAGLFILSNILTDVLYALVDPRVRLS